MHACTTPYLFMKRCLIKNKDKFTSALHITLKNYSWKCLVVANITYNELAAEMIYSVGSKEMSYSPNFK
jgi:hypothetical protein